VKIKRRDLATAIQELLDSKGLPSHLADLVDTLRAVGNFGAHPITDLNSGEIINVEPVEADLLLDVVDGPFDFYFVRPAKSKARVDKINQKLVASGKPPLKIPPA